MRRRWAPAAASDRQLYRCMARCLKALTLLPLPVLRERVGVRAFFERRAPYLPSRRHSDCLAAVWARPETGRADYDRLGFVGRVWSGALRRRRSKLMSGVRMAVAVAVVGWMIVGCQSRQDTNDVPVYESSGHYSRSSGADGSSS